MKHTIARILVGGSAAGSILFAGVASAIEWNVTGFVRQEIAYSISSSRNTNNDNGNLFNNRISPQIGDAGFGTRSGVAFTNGNSPFSNFNAPTSLHLDANGNIGGVFNNANARAAANGGAYTTTNQGVNGHGRFGLNGPKTVGAAGKGAGFGSAVFLNLGGGGLQPQDCHFAISRAVGAGNAAAGFGPRVLPGAIPGNTFPVNGFAGNCPGGPNTFASDSALAEIGVDPETKDRTNLNLFNSRLEIDVQAKISKEFAAYMKFRAYYDGTRHFRDSKTGNHFNSDIWGERGTLTEWASPDAIIDIPALYVDWNRGPLWIRFGNQTIAWGEAYFFRTTDVANGLDLRRHLTLGPGGEEYQDQRIASPGIRVSYTFNNGFELDMFAQMFSPTILPGQNTPYNLVPTSGARLDSSEGFDDAKGAINYGFRLTMPLTDSLTGLVAVVNRRNPDGLFVSQDAPQVHQGIANTGCLNNNNDTMNFFARTGFVGGATTVNGINAQLGAQGRDLFPTLQSGRKNQAKGCGTPFAPDARGTPSLQYWDAISKGRLDNGHYLRQVINEWPAAEWAVRDAFGFGSETNFADTYRTVEGFRSSFGPFIQWVGREFKRETIFMGGGNYLVTMNDQESLFDQLIIRGEVAVTPNKKITNDLSFDFTEVDDIVAALILEKYHRISDAFPATYFVFQWMHRTATDLFGRDLSKNDTPGIETFIDVETGNFRPAAFDENAMKPRGNGNANYVVFAFQQPFPDLIWRFDFAVLVDVAGGYLVQPGVRYRPAANWQWDLYANIIESPGGDNDTITETIDFADEVFLRLTYFF